MGDLEKLSALLERVDLVKEDSSEALELLNQALANLSSSDDSSIDGCEYGQKVSGLLGCGATDVEGKAAEVIAEVCKAEAPRPLLSTPAVLRPLLALLSSVSLEAKNQACRALGNICYDNNDGRIIVFENNGLVEIVAVLKESASSNCEVLRTNAAGCLLNVIMGQDQVYPKVMELGVMQVLCDLLSFGVSSKQAEETAIHIYVILGLLTDTGPGNITLSEKLCETTVKVLAESTNGELSELCVELLHSQAENDEVRLHLAKAGLCQLLIHLLEKHASQADDDETRNLLKMACDLIVLILNGDESMEVAYGDGKGEVFQGLVNWLDSSDDDLQVTAVLSMANFARTDAHCIQMVEQGVSKKLLELLEQNNTSDSQIRLQHALLSALRNLVIPSQNKSVVLEQGLLKAVYPMFTIPTFPVVFKLLGTLRMVIDGQPEAASELGLRDDVVDKLIEWCSIDNHPGVEGEANRLLAWIIKNSRDREVIGAMVRRGVVESLVKMSQGQHETMQAEAFLALNLTVAMRGQDAEGPLVAADVGASLSSFLRGRTPQREVFHNLLSFVSQLTNSNVMRKHLREKDVAKMLYGCTLSDGLSDLRDQVSRLTSLIEAG